MEINIFNLVLGYANDVNLLDENINTITKNSEITVQASEEIGLEVIMDRTKYI
jgi:hypothetical protein